MTLGEYLRETGKSAADVARESGVSTSTISRHLAGKHRLSGQNAVRLCEATAGACTLLDLLTSEVVEVHDG